MKKHFDKKLCQNSHYLKVPSNFDLEVQHFSKIEVSSPRRVVVMTYLLRTSCHILSINNFPAT